MGFLMEEVRGSKRKRRVCRHRHFLWVIPSLGFLMLLGSVQSGWALQRHQLAPGESGGQAVGEHSPTQQGAPGTPSTQQTAPPTSQAQQPHGPSPGTGASKGHEVMQPEKVAPVSPGTPDPAAPPHEAAPGEVAKPEVHEEHGPSLPEISPVAGVTFVETMINLMEHELGGRTLGWRPNDLLAGRFTDDVNNFQLGVLEAIRFTTLRLKDSLTRMGDADTYDPDLEQALNLFMNSATRFWLPSPETSYGEALDHMKKFLDKLKAGRRNFYYRKDSLTLLLATYRDLLGNVNRNLITADVSWFKTDDYFFYAKGVAHVYYEILRVVRVGYKNQLAQTLNATELLDEVLHELHRVEQMDPWIILNGKLDGFFANHRANLNAPLSEVNHLLVVLSQL